MGRRGGEEEGRGWGWGKREWTGGGGGGGEGFQTSKHNHRHDAQASGRRWSSRSDSSQASRGRPPLSVLTQRNEKMGEGREGKIVGGEGEE